jgi:hypothetical protein
MSSASYRAFLVDFAGVFGVGARAGGAVFLDFVGRAVVFAGRPEAFVGREEAFDGRWDGFVGL